MADRLKSLGIWGTLSIIAVIFIAFSGIYFVNSGEEAVVLRFGKLQSISSDAGPKYRIPFIETVTKVNVNEINRLEFGFKTTKPGSTKEKSKFEEILDEAQMLTGDENLALVEAIIQYRIIDSRKYLFKVDDPEGTLRMIAESAIRRGVASHTLDEALVSNKFGIQQEIKDNLQKICDKYNIGIRIDAVQFQDVQPPKEVDAAFKDVASAMEDKNSEINKANTFKNEKIPTARGNASKMINEAEGYKAARIDRAKGDVASFVQILDKYQQGVQVTKTRMYLETMEQVLPGIEKYIVNENGDTLKFLPLNDAAVIPNR